MKIKNFKKKKDGFYQITLENTLTITIHEDLILKYELLLKKEISLEDMASLEKENQIYMGYAKAIKKIKTKLRSTKEIDLYLKKEAFDKEQITDIIAILTRQGYLNDEVYANAFVNDRIHLSKDGPQKIENALRQEGIKNEIIEQALSCYTEELQEERIQKLIAKEIKSNHTKSGKMLEQKILYHLIELGYERSAITEQLQKQTFYDTDIRQKEYDKLYRTLSKKYEGKELEQRIRTRMYQKGFRDF